MDDHGQPDAAAAADQLPPPGWYRDWDDPHAQRWWDGRRWTDDRRWAPPAAGPPLSGRLRRAARVAQAVLAAAVIVEAAVAVSAWVPALDAVAVGGSGLASLHGLAAAMAVIAWFHAAYANLTRLGPGTPRWTTGWAVGAWLVPILNLVRPYTMAWECWTAGDPRQHRRVADRDYRRGQGRLLPAWWALWLAAVAAVVIAESRVTFFAPGGPPPTAAPSQGSTPPLLPVLESATLMAAGVLAILVVRRITARQLARVPASAVEAPTRRSLVAVAGGLALLGLASLVAASLATADLGGPARDDAVEAARFVAPGTATVNVTGEADAAVFVQTAGQAPTDAAVTGRLGECRATGPDGGPAALRRLGEDPGLGFARGGDRYDAVYVLEPGPTAGPHRIRCEAARPTSAAVGRVASPSPAAWIAPAVVAGVALLGAAVVVGSRA